MTGEANPGDGGIVISYWRCDQTGRTLDHGLFTELLAQELTDHFGAGKVFLDPAPTVCEDNQDELLTRLGACDVLLAVIHPEWLNDLSTGQDERVHEVLGTALRLRSGSALPGRRPVVVPVLLDRTELPRSAQLPDDLRELTLLQAFRLRFSTLTTDLARLITELELHVKPHWPAADPPPSDPAADDAAADDTAANTARRTGCANVTVTAMPGYAVSRGSIIAVILIGVLLWRPTDSDWTSVTFLLIRSTMTVTVTLLSMVTIRVFERQIHGLEHHLHVLPRPWLLIVRLSIVSTLAVLTLAFSSQFDGYYAIALFILLPGSLLLLFGTLMLTARDMVEDEMWPPRVGIRPIALRRAITRLEHRLTSSWRPPLSRLQREQTEQIVRQLDSALVIMRQFQQRTRTRVGWLRYGGRWVAMGYAVWLAATLGFAAAATRESFDAGDVIGGYLSIPIGLLACVFGIGTLELMYRHDQSSWRRFVEEIEKDIGNRLRRHLPAQRQDKP